MSLESINRTRILWWVTISIRLPLDVRSPIDLGGVRCFWVSNFGRAFGVIVSRGETGGVCGVMKHDLGAEKADQAKSRKNLTDSGAAIGCAQFRHTPSSPAYGDR